MGKINEQIHESFIGKMTEAEKQWLEAFEKLENFNDGRELELLGVKIPRNVKKQTNRKSYSRKNQLVAGKRNTFSLDKLEEANNGQEFLTQDNKFEYTSKGQKKREANADKKIKQELVMLDNLSNNFRKELMQAFKQGKNVNCQVYSEQKTKNGGYSKLTLAEKLLARMQFKFYQDNNMESRIGIFNEGVVS